MNFNPFKTVFWAVFGFFAFFTLMGSWTVVNSGERGVYVVLGKASDTVLSDGLHFKLPWISSVKKISIRIQKSEAGSEAASRDMQKVHVVVALNWHLDSTKVNNVFRSIGDESAITERILTPAVNEVLKAATAKLTAEEILNKRIELKDTVDEMLKKRLAQYNVIVDDVSLVDLQFTKEFNEAVEQKQIAEQMSKRAEYVAIQAEKEAHAAVNKAKGEAEANRLTQISLTPQLLQYETIKRWNGILPTTMMGNTVPFVNVK